MRAYEEIYNEMLQKGERFTIRELITIFENESSWVGTNYQLNQIKGYNLEITGVRTGDCQGCMLTAIKNVARWVNKYEKDNSNKQLTLINDKQLNKRRTKNK